MESREISLEEAGTFFEFYLEGILSTGLLKPLAEFGLGGGRVAMAARSWYELQVQGLSPQQALAHMQPGFSSWVRGLLVLGFEKSALDLVLEDLIVLQKERLSPSQTEVALRALIDKYHGFNNSVVCSDCGQAEFSQMVARALLEGAREVILQQEGDFLLQKYLGVKLVAVREASVPAVYLYLKNTLESFAGKALTLEQGRFDVMKRNSHEYELRGVAVALAVRFE